VRVCVAAATAVVAMVVAPDSSFGQATPERRDAVAPAPAPTPTPTPATPSPAPARLRLDIDRHIDDVLARKETQRLPRFEEKIEVVDRSQSALDDLLRGLDLSCGPSATGPPPTSELNAHRGATIPVHADFLAAAKLLLKGLQRLNHPKPRWFLYSAKQGELVRFILREGEVSEAVKRGTPGTTWEELARFHDRGSAADALRRLERGFATPERQANGDRLPPWVATTCRPPGFR
jgi:hypothetical protein